MHVPAVHPVHRQAIVNGGQVVVVALTSPQGQQTQGPPAGGLGRGGDHQTTAVPFVECRRLIGPQVHEPKAPGGLSGWLGPQRNPMAIDPTHLGPAVEVKAPGPTEPAPAQAGEGGFKADTGHQPGVMDLNQPPLDTSPEHHQEQQRPGLGLRHGGATG